MTTKVYPIRKQTDRVATLRALDDLDEIASDIDVLALAAIGLAADDERGGQHGDRIARRLRDAAGRVRDAARTLSPVDLVATKAALDQVA